MTRHSQNSTAKSVFTRHEKEAAGWGSQTKRFGRDSTKPFDHCTLCIHPVRDPVACPEGHIFCKECIYSNLLAQKEDIAIKLEAWDEDQRRKQSEANERARQAEDAKFHAFERGERGILPSTSRMSNSSGARDQGAISTALVVCGAASSRAVPASAVPSNESESQREKREKLEKDQIVTALSFRQDMRSEEQKTEDMRKTSFWIPEMVPSAPTAVEKPLTVTMCPMGSRPCRAKKLLRLKFTVESDIDTNNGSSSSSSSSSSGAFRKSEGTLTSAEKSNGRAAHEGRYQCPSCRKTLNSQKVSAMKKCGHVLCGSCVDQFVLPEGRCLVCGVAVRPKDILPLQQGGTGFAAHNDVQTTKYMSSMR